MGKPVTLDSDDVEVLLNAAAATAKIDSLLLACKQDPTMIRLQVKGAIEQALDRVNRARGQAIRDTESILGPPLDWKPVPEIIKCLGRLVAAGPRGVIVDASDLFAYATLRSYGLAVAGQVNSYVNWGDKTQEVIGPSHEQRYKITDEGKKWMRWFAAEPKEGTNDKES